jgi:NAD(P)-dependent dehydrogenase (short-subunit alcohol dehydrogenase family)
MSEPKVWLVTGSSRGLGRAVVTAAAGSGARVMATARRPGDLADLVAAYPGQVEAVARNAEAERWADLSRSTDFPTS